MIETLLRVLKMAGMIVLLTLFIAYAGIWGIVSYLAFALVFAGIILWQKRKVYMDVVRFGSDMILHTTRKGENNGKENNGRQDKGGNRKRNVKDLL